MNNIFFSNAGVFFSDKIAHILVTIATETDNIFKKKLENLVRVIMLFYCKQHIYLKYM